MNTEQTSNMEMTPPLSPATQTGKEDMSNASSSTTPLAPGAPLTPVGRWAVGSYTTPHDTFEAMVKTAVAKANHKWNDTLIHAFLAGAYIGLGGLLSLMCGTMPAAKADNPGLQKLVFGMVFPVGLFAIVVTGAELYTSNVLVFSGWLDRRISAKQMIGNISLVWVMNFVGSLWLAGMVYWTDVVSGPYAEAAKPYFEHKVHQPIDVAFAKGIFCNWLVALAIFLASSAHDLAGKAIGVWPPIAAFVAIGFDHCVANMFFLPLGLMIGCDYNIGEMLYRNIIPVTVGNFVGSLLVSVAYSIVEKKTRWHNQLPAPVTRRCTAHMSC
eukprot:comp19876_c0_seq1/m.24029 comp19876_c0_seq1/g.24029  ORF comp19876_c0_seq1/g.24029 comp19876_c0_seq1/m.24029 type:complete len:326 (-) comp19876_c0_seq1:328-1305(-)